MVRYDTYHDTGITIWYVSRYIYYPLIYEMQNCVIEVLVRIYYNIWGNTYHDTIFSLAIRIVGAVYRYIVIHWWIVTSLSLNHQRPVRLAWSQCANTTKVIRIKRRWQKSNQFWMWSGYICMPNLRPFLPCILQEMPWNHKFDKFH